jgi:hypothetical protein
MITLLPLARRHEEFRDITARHVQYCPLPAYIFSLMCRWVEQRVGLLGQAFSCKAGEKSGLGRVLWRAREPGVSPASDNGESGADSSAHCCGDAYH